MRVDARRIGCRQYAMRAREVCADVMRHDYETVRLYGKLVLRDAVSY